MTFPPASDESILPDPDERRIRRTLWWQGGIVLLVLAVLVVGISPAPYVVERPGPVYNTIGTTTIDEKSVPIIDVDGAKTYPTEGELDLLTVYLDGSREHPINWFDVVAAHLDGTKSVLDVDAVFPNGETADEASQQSAIDMQASQSDAIAAALQQLDIAYETSVIAEVISNGSPADGTLKPGDVFVAIDGAPIASDADVRAGVQKAGVGTPLQLEILRDGTPMTLELTPVERSKTDANPMIGVIPGYRYTFPFDVNIRLKNVGGPSAGMMFALGIYDTLTPGALTGGEHIAGTGTITPEGTVGPIGGILQKMYGARSAGAEWFLAPSSNCAALAGKIPADLAVFSIDTLDQAVDVVAAIGAGESTSSFARCEG